MTPDLDRDESSSSHTTLTAAADDGFRRATLALLYWVITVGVLLWAFDVFRGQRMAGWWMILGLFLLTHTDPAAAVELRRWRWLVFPLASLGCVMLVYGTSEWWFAVFEGWSSGSNDPLVQSVAKRLWLVTGYSIGTVLAALVLVGPVLRTLGHYTVWVLVGGLFILTIGRLSNLLFDADEWRNHGFAICAILFRGVVVGCGTGAIAARWQPTARIFPRLRAVAGRVWRGDIDLRWVMLLVYPSTVAISIVLVILSANFSGNRPDGSVSLARTIWMVTTTQIISLLIFVAGSLMAIRALSRSPGKHRVVTRVGQSLIGILALTIFVSVAKSYGFLAGEQVQSSLSVLLGTAYRFRIAEDEKQLGFVGVMTFGAADELERQLRLHPGTTELKLSSGGGLVSEGHHMADVVRDFHINTLVTESCTSACVYPFLAGQKHILAASGKLGFHRTVNVGLSGESWDSCGAFRTFSIPAYFCKRIEATPPSSMWYPTREELVAAHLLSPGSG